MLCQAVLRYVLLSCLKLCCQGPAFRSESCHDQEPQAVPMLLQWILAPDFARRYLNTRTLLLSESVGSAWRREQFLAKLQTLSHGVKYHN